MSDHDKLREKIRAWLKSNQELLPLNNDVWEIETLSQGDEKPVIIDRRKHKTSAHAISPFYKPYTKLMNLQHE